MNYLKIKYIYYIHQDDKATLIEEVKDAENENKDFFTHKPYRIITKDNKIKWVLDYTVTQKDRNGNIIYFIGYIIDITEQKELEENLIKAKTSSYSTRPKSLIFFSRLLILIKFFISSI